MDQAGDLVAGLEVSASARVPTLPGDLGMSTIAARAAGERAAALADARGPEVKARSTDLLAAADAGRIKLERTLHDGAGVITATLSALRTEPTPGLVQPWSRWNAP